MDVLPNKLEKKKNVHLQLNFNLFIALIPLYYWYSLQMKIYNMYIKFTTVVYEKQFYSYDSECVIKSH